MLYMESAHYRRVATGKLDSLSARTLNPRRKYPTVQVFVDGILTLEDEVLREDARRVVESIVTEDLCNHLHHPGLRHLRKTIVRDAFLAAEREASEAASCDCMTEDPGDGLGERVVTHSRRCPLHPAT